MHEAVCIGPFHVTIKTQPRLPPRGEMPRQLFVGSLLEGNVQLRRVQALVQHPVKSLAVFHQQPHGFLMGRNGIHIALAQQRLQVCDIGTAVHLLYLRNARVGALEKKRLKSRFLPFTCPEFSKMPPDVWSIHTKNGILFL